MVGGVETSVGSSAYLKGAQLGSGSSAANRNKPAESTYKETESTYSTSNVSEKPSVASVKSASESSESAPVQQTELQSRNDESTLRTEQARGSLLDIAV